MTLHRIVWILYLDVCGVDYYRKLHIIDTSSILVYFIYILGVYQ
jgi:hypothetical protein